MCKVVIALRSLGSGYSLSDLAFLEPSQQYSFATCSARVPSRRCQAQAFSDAHILPKGLQGMASHQASSRLGVRAASTTVVQQCCKGDVLIAWPVLWAGPLAFQNQQQ